MPAKGTTTDSTSIDTETTVYRIEAHIATGEQAGYPLCTGFSDEHSFHDEGNAEEVATDIRNNPVEYFPAALRELDADINVNVYSDDRAI